MIAPADLVIKAREWLGVPFLHQGRTHLGCDCLGFIAGVLNELGSTTLLAHLPNNYRRDPQALLVDGLEALCRRIELQAGALVLIRFPEMAHPSHAAIYTGKSLIHAYQTAGKVVEHNYGEPWVRQTDSIWAAPLVVYE